MLEMQETIRFAEELCVTIRDGCARIADVEAEEPSFLDPRDVARKIARDIRAFVPGDIS